MGTTQNIQIYQNTTTIEILISKWANPQGNFPWLSHLLTVERVTFRFHPVAGHTDPEGGRGMALLFHDLGTRWGWMVSVTPRPPLPPGKTRYPLYRRLGGRQGRSGRVCENLAPIGIRSTERPAHCKSLYRLSYPGTPLSRGVSINAPNCWPGFLLLLYQQWQALLALTCCENRTTTVTGAGIPYVAISGGSSHAVVNSPTTPLGTSVNNH
jgi:hypothetical protein